MIAPKVKPHQPYPTQKAALMKALEEAMVPASAANAVQRRLRKVRKQKPKFTFPLGSIATVPDNLPPSIPKKGKH